VRASAVDDVVVVIGAYQVETEARTVKCLEWERGPGASLRCGLEELGDDIEAAVVVLADGPNLHPHAIDRVVSAWQAGGGPIVAAAYRGQRLHPVLIDRSAWDSVPDAGLRDLPADVVDCTDLGSPGDVDTPADLR
jgi:CTP:molybdopterin cytidylyltransferase MocA